MLVLSRKVGEKILVPATGMEVTILDVQGDKVRVGITAPPEVRVYRQEVWQRMQKNAAAAQQRVEAAVQEL